MVAAALSSARLAPYLSIDQVTLAEKKSLGVELTEMEQLADSHWLKSFSYSKYSAELSRRVHHLSDKVIFLDLTYMNLAGVHLHPLDRENIFSCAKVPLLQFTNGQLIPLTFSRSQGTEYVVFSNSSDRKEIVITEKKVSECALRVFHFSPRLLLKLKRTKDMVFVAQPNQMSSLSPHHLSMIAGLPVDDSDLTDEDKQILNKKVCGLQNLGEDGDHLRCLLSSSSYREVFNDKQSRVHLFVDGYTRMIDSTKQKIAKPVYEDKLEDEFIALSGVKVVFDPSNLDYDCSRFFRAISNIDSVIIRDFKDLIHWQVIEMIEHSEDRTAPVVIKTFYVNIEAPVEVELEYPHIKKKEFCFKALSSPPPDDDSKSVSP